MTMANVVFADVSSLTVGGGMTGIVEGCNAFQANEPQENRPLYVWGKTKPAVNLGVPVLGSGSFSYVASDGTNSSATTDWKTALKGRDTDTLTVSGGLWPTGTAQTLTLTNVLYQSKSSAMNAKNEMVITISFSFSEGLN